MRRCHNQDDPIKDGSISCQLPIQASQAINLTLDLDSDESVTKDGEIGADAGTANRVFAGYG